MHDSVIQDVHKRSSRISGSIPTADNLFLLNLFCSSLPKPLLPTLPEFSILGKPGIFELVHKVYPCVPSDSSEIFRSVSCNVSKEKNIQLVSCYIKSKLQVKIGNHYHY